MGKHNSFIFEGAGPFIFNIMRLLIIPIFVFAMTFYSCSQAKKEIDNIDFKENVADESIDQYDLIKNEISNRFYQGNFESCKEFLDYESLVKRTIKGTYAEKDYSIEMIKTFAKGLYDGGEYWKQTAYGITYYDLVKEYKNSEGNSVLVYRSFGSDGLDYDEYILSEDNRKIIDVYNVGKGELLSETMRQLLVGLTNEYNTNDLEKIKSVTNDALKMISFYQNGDYEKAIQILESFPDQIKKTKVMRLNKIRFYLWYDEEVYKKIVEEYRSDFPNDASLDLVMYDYFYINKNYSRALENMILLESKYPDDPVIKYYMGDLYLMLGECDKAIFSYKEAIDGDNLILEFQDGLSLTYLECSDRTKAFNIIDELMAHGYYTQELINQFLLETYKGVEKWPEYQQWISQY